MGFVLDAIDRRILRELQADATVPIAELAERAGLSQTPCWKRVKRLTDAGVIEKRVALLDWWFSSPSRPAATMRTG
jgi:Lrp/AsnC family transcriptional regulator